MAGVSIIAGDDVSIGVSIPAGSLGDLTGASVFMTVKTAASLATIDPTDSDAVIKSDPLVLTSNVSSWSFPLNTTKTRVPTGNYVWDVQVVDVNGVVTTLYLRDNTFTVLPDVTQRTS